MAKLKNSKKIMERIQKERVLLESLRKAAEAEIPANNIMNDQQKKEFLSRNTDYVSPKKNNSTIYRRVRTCAELDMSTNKSRTGRK